MREFQNCFFVLVFSAVIGTGCYSMRPSSGAGQTDFSPPRKFDAADVAVPNGYRVEVVARDLTFPTGMTFDDNGRIYVVESGYSYGEMWTTPKLLRIRADGQTETIASGGRNGPWNGVTFSRGEFFVAEGGVLEGGKILRITPDGKTTALISNLPSFGDHHTDGPVVGPDGQIYFGQGTASNSGVIGEDNAKFGWLKRRPQFHDIPGQDITLTGQNFETENVLAGKGSVKTGAFLPFGMPSRPGQIIKGQILCSGGVMRISPSGGKPELVAWGFRNPYGLTFSPDGKLFVSDNSYDDRGSRPVWGTSDLLWQVKQGIWHGWPDFTGDDPLTEKDYQPPGKPPLKFLMANHPNQPPKPTAYLGAHAAAGGLDFSRSAKFGHRGDVFIALFGDQAPTVGKVMHPVGTRVVRVNVATGVIEDFAVNKGKKNGPASKIGGGGLERPLAVRFSPDGTSLYIVDFGVLNEDKNGSKPQPRTGAIWRVTREGGAK